jgi:hypothetical protein
MSWIKVFSTPARGCAKSRANDDAAAIPEKFVKILGTEIMLATNTA